MIRFLAYASGYRFVRPARRAQAEKVGRNKRNGFTAGLVDDDALVATRNREARRWYIGREDRVDWLPPGWLMLNF